MPELTERFESWLLQRVAHAVEAGEVSADLLTELQAEIVEAHKQSPTGRQALAIE